MARSTYDKAKSTIQMICVFPFQFFFLQMPFDVLKVAEIYYCVYPHPLRCPIKFVIPDLTYCRIPPLLRVCQHTTCIHVVPKNLTHRKKIRFRCTSKPYRLPCGGVRCKWCSCSRSSRSWLEVLLYHNV